MVECFPKVFTHIPKPQPVHINPAAQRRGSRRNNSSQRTGCFDFAPPSRWFSLLQTRRLVQGFSADFGLQLFKPHIALQIFKHRRGGSASFTLSPSHSPELPEAYTGTRPLTQVNASYLGPDIAAETAVAMASASMLFRPTDSANSRLLLKHVQELFVFADSYRGCYSNSIPKVQSYYNSSGYGDELLWAAAWLYHATGNMSYLTYATVEGNSFVSSVLSVLLQKILSTTLSLSLSLSLCISL